MTGYEISEETLYEIEHAAMQLKLIASLTEGPNTERAFGTYELNAFCLAISKPLLRIVEEVLNQPGATAAKDCFAMTARRLAKERQS